jgi:hypothetical protein
MTQTYRADISSKSLLYTILFHIWWVTDLSVHRLDLLSSLQVQDVHALDGLRDSLLLDWKTKRVIWSVPYQHLYLDRKCTVCHNTNPPWTMCDKWSLNNQSSCLIVCSHSPINSLDLPLCHGGWATFSWYIFPLENGSCRPECCHWVFCPPIWKTTQKKLLLLA